MLYFLKSPTEIGIIYSHFRNDLHSPTHTRPTWWKQNGVHKPRDQKKRRRHVATLSIYGSGSVALAPSCDGMHGAVLPRCPLYFVRSYVITCSCKCYNRMLCSPLLVTTTQQVYKAILDYKLLFAVLTLDYSDLCPEWISYRPTGQIRVIAPFICPFQTGESTPIFMELPARNGSL